MNAPLLTTETLLKNMLHNPSQENYEQTINFISGAGYNDFLLSLRANNVLCIIFLKNYVQRWIDSGILQNFYSEDFVSFLINCCAEKLIKENNWVHVADFIETLSNHYMITEQILQSLIAKRTENPRFLMFIDAIFKKYTVHSRSNRLFTEIKRSIELFFPVFTEIFFSPAIVEQVERAYHTVVASAQQVANGDDSLLIKVYNRTGLGMNLEYILSIFYSLVYQDIHPLFEDNVHYFFKLFFVIFNENQTIVNDIFDLFISKYPEITNFDLIILTLCRIETLDPQFINTLTDAFNHSQRFSSIVTAFIKRILLTAPPTEDWLVTTQNIVKNNDMTRGCLHRLIRLVNCDVNLFGVEEKLFIASVLKRKDQDLYNEASQIVKSPNSNIELAFTAFRYLLRIQEYPECSLCHLNTDVKFICMKLISNSLKSRDTYHREAILKSKVFGHSSSLHSINSRPFSTCLGVSVANILPIVKITLDEFSAELLFRIIKDDETQLTNELYESITRLFTDIIRMPTITVNFLIDIYIILSLKLKRYSLALIEKILNEELVDMYCVCFMYMSVLMKETTIKSSFVLYILSQTELWETRELHSGLTMILISSYEIGIITREQVMNIVRWLDGYNRVLVFSRLMIPYAGDLTTEEVYLINNVFDETWFLENFMNKKYVRLVLKKLITDENVSSQVKQNVIMKNMMNIEYEGMLHSVVRYFDI